MRLRPALAGTVAVAATVVGHGFALGLLGGRRLAGAGDNGDGYRLFCTVGLRPDTPEGNAAWRGVVVTDFTTGHPACGPVTSSAGVLLRAAVEGAGPIWTVTTLAWLLVALTAAGAGAAAAALAESGRWRPALVAIPIAPLVVVPWWSRFDVSTYAEPAGLLGTVWVVLGALVVAGTERTRRGARATALALLTAGGLTAATAKPGLVGVGVVAALACATVAAGEHPRRSRIAGLVAAALVVALGAAPVVATLRTQARDYGPVNATNLIFTALLPEAGPAVLGPLGLPADAARSAGESYYWAGARDVPGWDAAVGADPAAARDRALTTLAAEPGAAARMVGRGLTATLRPQLGYLPSTPRGAVPERNEVRTIYPETAPVGDLGRTWADGVRGPWAPAVVAGLALAAGAVTLHPRLPLRRRPSSRVHLAVGVARTAALTSTAALGVVVPSVLGDGYYELTKHVWIASYLLADTTVLLVVAALGATAPARRRRLPRAPGNSPGTSRPRWTPSSRPARVAATTDVSSRSGGRRPMALDPHSSTVDGVVRRAARRTPDRTALVFGDRTWTYRELDDGVSRTAAYLLDLGVSPGDRVATYGKNSDAYVLAFLGCSRAGAVHVPINFALTGEELSYLITQSGSGVLFVDPVLRERVDALDEQPAHVLALRDADDSLVERARAGEVPSIDVEVADTDLAQLLYTSGTTSKPKGAMMTHRALTYHYASGIHALGMTADDEPLHAMPLYHSAGMQLFMLPYLAVGATNHLIETPDIPEVLRRIETDGIGAVFLAPTVWVPLVNHDDFATRDLSSLRKAFYGASIMPGPILARLREALPALGVYNCFGQSEIGPLATVLQPEEHDARPDSCGRPVLFVELRVVDDEGHDVEPGGTGEVVYASPQLCVGYWDKPEETEEVFRDGWFHSGDMVRIDEEGFITVVDRIKDVINTGGVLVASREVEDALYTHESVAEVAVVGTPDDRWIEAVTAFVVLKSEVDGDQLIAHAKTRLAGYKVPKSVHVVDELPRNQSGKLLKRVLRDQLEKSE